MKYHIIEYIPCLSHEGCPGHFDIENDNEELLTTIALPASRLEEGKQVVKACNCFDDLLKALRAVVKWETSEASGKAKVTAEEALLYVETMKLAIETIAKAEVKP